ncbi:MAG: translation elongation factor Ts [Acidobacteriia bacterium]|nr:translation elongation factor Ts [Terriglobia bacterium]
MGISAQEVKELREQTGAGMMECKKALTEAAGNMEEAITILRKRGLASAAKKAGRITSEGLVEARIAGASGKQIGVVVEVNCETDFVARTDDFKNFVSQVAIHLLSHPCKEVEELLQQKFSAAPALNLDPSIPTLIIQPGAVEGSKTVGEMLTERIAQIGENIAVRRFERFEAGDSGTLGKYIHAGGKIGVLVEMGSVGKSPQADSEVQELVHDIAMHIAASDPRYLGRQDVPAEVLEKEKDIARAKVPPGKPAPVVEKIVEGQLSKFYGEVCLLEQPFVKEPGMSVGQWITQKSQSWGGSAEVRRYARFKTGEGLEKRGSDFAGEVAAQLK